MTRTTIAAIALQGLVVVVVVGVVGAGAS